MGETLKTTAGSEAGNMVAARKYDQAEGEVWNFIKNSASTSSAKCLKLVAEATTKILLQNGSKVYILDSSKNLEEASEEQVNNYIGSIYKSPSWGKEDLKILVVKLADQAKTNQILCNFVSEFKSCLENAESKKGASPEQKSTINSIIEDRNENKEKLEELKNLMQSVTSNSDTNIHTEILAQLERLSVSEESCARKLTELDKAELDAIRAHWSRSLPLFHGNRDEDVTEFLGTMERYRFETRFSDNHLISVTLAQLRSGAKDIVNNLLPLHDRSWYKLRKILVDSYEHGDTYPKLIRQFRETKYKGSAQVYAQKFTHILSKLPHLDEAEKRFQFLEGLPGDIRFEIIKVDKNMDIQSMVRLAITYEEATMDNKNRGLRFK